MILNKSGTKKKKKKRTMDNEEEKKEDKGEHINLKVKDQVRAGAVFLSRVSLSLFFFFFFFFFFFSVFRALCVCARARSFERERERKFCSLFFFKTRGEEAIFFFRASLSLLSPSL